jgi:hypothetical protein
MGKHYEIEKDTKELITSFESELETIKVINELILAKTSKKNHFYFNIKNAVVYSQHHDYFEHTAVFIIWYLINNLSSSASIKPESRQFIDDAYLYNPIRNVLRHFGKGEVAVEKDLNLLLILAENYKEFAKITEEEIDRKEFNKFFVTLFDSSLVKSYLNINQHNDVTYFGKENFDELTDWLFSILIFELLKSKPTPESFEKTEIKLIELFKLCDEIKSVAIKCGFKLDIFIDILENIA